MKKVWWIPSRCERLFDDILLLNFYVSRFRKACRDHPSFRTNRQRASTGICEICQRATRSLEAHHIVPVWALALNHVCTILAADDSCIKSGGTWPTWTTVHDGRYEDWNAAGNLVTVCTVCHATHETRSNLTYTEGLQRKYAPSLAFGYEAARKLFLSSWDTGL